VRIRENPFCLCHSLSGSGLCVFSGGGSSGGGECILGIAFLLYLL
jgi:hypothetical protein